MIGRDGDKEIAVSRMAKNSESITNELEYQMSIEEQSREIEKDKTDTDIIVKSDGSRVLVVTINVGGMRSSMSMEISKPTMLQNDMSNQRIEDSRLLRSENVEMTEEV